MSNVISAERFQEWVDEHGHQVNLGFVFLNDKTATYSGDIDLDELPGIFARKQFPEGHPSVAAWADDLRRRDREVAPGDELRAVRAEVEEHWRAIIDMAIEDGEL